MDDTVTSVKLASAMRATQRRLRVRLRVALRIARVGSERPAAACGLGRRRTKAKQRAASSSSEPPPRNAPVGSVFRNAPPANMAIAVIAARTARITAILGGLAR